MQLVDSPHAQLAQQPPLHVVEQVPPYMLPRVTEPVTHDHPQYWPEGHGFGEHALALSFSYP